LETSDEEFQPIRHSAHFEPKPVQNEEEEQPNGVLMERIDGVWVPVDRFPWEEDDEGGNPVVNLGQLGERVVFTDSDSDDDSGPCIHEIMRDLQARQYQAYLEERERNKSYSDEETIDVVDRKREIKRAERDFPSLNL
jgi:hypothetical protein